VNADALLETLRGLELKLHRPEVRGDREELSRLLHPKFREFGRSGRIYERLDVLAEFSTRPQEYAICAQDFNLMSLSDTLVLLTYRSAHVKPDGQLERHTNRASLWELTDLGWQLIFHQGTPTDAFLSSAT